MSKKKPIHYESELIRGRKVLVAMTGSIACFKACGVVSELVQRGARVRVMMTRSATRFVTPLTLEALTEHPVWVELFGDQEAGDSQHLHIDLSRFAEVIAVIPATANIVGKMACGIADDLVSTTLLSSNVPILVAPAMNVHLYQNPIVQRNLKILEEFGHHVVEPDEGFLSCGDYGRGRLPGVEELVQEIVYLLRRRSGLEGKRVLVTAGRTEEPFDPVRHLTNQSSGKMGYAVARAARRFGAEVVLVSGPADIRPPRGIRFIPVRRASEMADAVKREAKEADLVVMSAAVSDFSPAAYSEEKIRREAGGLSVPLEATEDILATISRERKPGSRIVGFAMETSDVEANARRKLESKGIDIIVGNDPLEPGAGFGADFIRAVVIDRNGRVEELPVLEKEIMAERLIEFAIKAMDG